MTKEEIRAYTDDNMSKSEVASDRYIATLNRIGYLKDKLAKYQELAAEQKAEVDSIWNDWLDTIPGGRASWEKYLETGIVDKVI